VSAVTGNSQPLTPAQPGLPSVSSYLPALVTFQEEIVSLVKLRTLLPELLAYFSGWLKVLAIYMD